MTHSVHSTLACRHLITQKQEHSNAFSQPPIRHAYGLANTIENLRDPIAFFFLLGWCNINEPFTLQ